MSAQADTNLNYENKLKKFFLSWIYTIFISIMWFQAWSYFDVSFHVNYLTKRSVVMNSELGFSLPDHEDAQKVNNSFIKKSICSLFFSLPFGMGLGTVISFYLIIFRQKLLGTLPLFFWIIFSISLCFYGGNGQNYLRQTMFFLYPFYLLIFNPVKSFVEFTKEESKKLQKQIISVVFVIALLIAGFHSASMINFIFIRDILKNVISLESYIDKYYEYTLYPASMIRNTSKKLPVLIKGAKNLPLTVLPKYFVKVESELADYTISKKNDTLIVRSIKNKEIHIKDYKNIRLSSILKILDLKEKDVHSLNRIVSLCIRILFPVACVFFIMILVIIAIQYRLGKIAVCIIVLCSLFIVFKAHQIKNTDIKEILKPGESLLNCILFCTVNYELSKKQYTENTEWFKENLKNLSRPAIIWVIKNAMKKNCQVIEQGVVELLKSDDPQIVYKSAEYVGKFKVKSSEQLLREAFHKYKWWYVKSYIYYSLLRINSQL